MGKYSRKFNYPSQTVPDETMTIAEMFSNYIRPDVRPDGVDDDDIDDPLRYDVDLTDTLSSHQWSDVIDRERVASGSDNDSGSGEQPDQPSASARDGSAQEPSE